MVAACGRDPLGRVFRRVTPLQKVQPAVLGGVHHGCGKDMGGVLLCRRRQLQQPILGDQSRCRPRDPDAVQGGPAVRERACLVEHGRPHPGKPLKGSAVLDDDSGVGRPACAREECHRSSNEQRARGGDDEDLCEPHWILAEIPAHSGQGEREEREWNRVPVCKPDHRRPARGGLLDQCHDLAVLRVFRRGGRQHAHGVVAVDGSAEQRIAFDMFRRQALTRQS